MTTPGNRQSGVMLLEALIGILLFSIGILALLGMQAIGMRATVDAKYRSEASFLANEIVGVMWGDAGNLDGYADASCAGTTRCAAWRARVAQVLPGSDVPTIVVADRQATITVFWTRPGDSSTSKHEVVAQIARSTDP